MMKRVLCAWFPNWPIQRRLCQQPELKQQAYLLYEETARGLRVVACSDLAVSRGIRLGIPLAEARGLCETTPSKTSAAKTSAANLVTDVYNPDADRRLLQYFAQQCQTYSPLVSIEERPAPESLLLEITGCEIHFGGEQALAQQVGKHFTTADYHVRIAIGDTVGAAWAMAHFGVTANQAVAILPPSQARDVLYKLPVAALRLSPKILEVLQKLDIRNIGQLEKLPRTTLPVRFGKELLWRLDQIWGTAPELIHPERVPEPQFAVWHSEDPVANREAHELIQRQLLDQVLEQLVPLRAGIRELDCLLKGMADSLTLTLRLVQPTVDRAHLLQLLRLERERHERQCYRSRSKILRCLEEGVTSIQLTATATALLRVRQQTLFELEPDQKLAQSFRQLVERLSSRLGQQAVVWAQATPDAQPEYACRYLTSTEANSTGPSTNSLANKAPHQKDMAAPELALNSWKASLLRSRPLKLFQPPEPLRILSSAPGGSPHQIWLGTQSLQVLRAWGPERIETGWWREQDIQRDYYRVETDQGFRLWIYQCLQTGQWFLHGSYD